MHAASRARTAVPLLGFAALAAALFLPALLGEAVFFRRDVHGLFYPRIETFVRSVAGGSWPLWDPLSAFGLPLLADPTSQSAYPFTWLNLVLLPARYYSLFAFVHCAGSGLGLYALCRSWGLAPAPSFLAGALWSSGGPFLSLIGMAPHFASAAFIPWVLLALDKALAAPSAQSCLVLGTAAALQVLAGGGEMSLITALLGLLLAAARLERPTGPAMARLTAVGGISLVWALALSAVQVLPAIGLLRAAGRAALDPAESMGWSLHPLSLPDLVVPGLWTELPLAPAARRLLFEGREPFLQSLYLGAGAALAVALAPLTARRRLLIVAGSGLGFFALAALGRHTPLFPNLLLPLLGLFRYPVKYIVPAAFLWSVLAALGAEAFRRSWAEGERRYGRRLAGLALILAVVALLLAAGARWAPETVSLRWWAASGPGLPEPRVLLSLKLLAFAAVTGATALVMGFRARASECPRWAFFSLLGLLVVDAVLAGRSANLLGPPSLLTLRPPVLQKLGPDAADHRIAVVSHPTWDLVTRGPAGWRREWAWALGLREMLYPPTAACWRLAGSFDGDVNAFAPRELPQLNRALYDSWGTSRAVRLLQMGNVGYVISLGGVSTEGLVEVATIPSVFASPIQLLKVPDPLPPVHVVDRARAGGEGLAGILDPAFDARMEVLLPAGAPALSGTAGFRGGASILERRADRLTVEVEASGPAYLVVPEAFDPGWRATVDGAPAAVWRANFLFRAIGVPAGRHVVRLRYLPPLVLWGAAISALAGAASLGFALKSVAVTAAARAVSSSPTPSRGGR